MPRIRPPHLFPPHIAERGLLYFQQGKVRDVQKTSAECYRAEIFDSKSPFKHHINITKFPAFRFDTPKSSLHLKMSGRTG